MSTRTAREHVRVGRALEALPVMTAAFGAGQLSYSKVRAMTRVATPKSEADLVAVALHGTASHIDRIVAGFCQVKRNVDPERGRMQLRRRGIWLHTRQGHTKKPNLFLVCLYHHKVLHEGGWDATGDADGALTFTNARGRPMLEVSLPPPRSDATAIRREHVAAGIHIDADTIIPNLGAGERLDLDHAVQALWYLDPPTGN